ncbi:MAG: hypothetical protein ABI379_02650 [Rhodanobacter sp.]
MLKVILLVLQLVAVAFLWVHDWVPLGSLNDVRAVRRQDTFGRLVVVTLIQSLPFTVILILCVTYFGQQYPHWLITTLWVAYVALFVGQLRAWWVPYLLRAEPARALRYRAMFGSTHSFLPERNGLVPNTAHIFLHLCTAATLVVLFLM